MRKCSLDAEDRCNLGERKLAEVVPLICNAFRVCSVIKLSNYTFTACTVCAHSIQIARHLAGDTEIYKVIHPVNRRKCATCFSGSSVRTSSIKYRAADLSRTDCGSVFIAFTRKRLGYPMGNVICYANFWRKHCDTSSLQLWIYRPSLCKMENN